MKKNGFKHLGVAVLMAAAIGCSAKDETTRMSIDQLPEEVRSTLESEAGNARIVEIEKRIRDGETSYRAEVTTGSERLIVQLSKDGRLIASKMDDKDVKLEDVPEAVRATIEAELKGGTIEALEQSGDRPGTYEFVYGLDGKQHELRIDKSGKVVERK